jgi:hypothetical protein
MVKFKAIKTEYDDDFGIIDFIHSDKELVIATSAMPQLFGVESTEEFLAEHWSKYKIYGEDRNFDWEKDFPKEWSLVEVEIKIL